MKSLAFAVLMVSCAGAAMAADLEAVTHRATSAAIIAPVKFAQECEKQSSRLLCAARFDDAQKGADFMSDLAVEEARNGVMPIVKRFLRVKQFAERAYDECMLRHEADIEASGIMTLEVSICGLAKSDVYSGMTWFKQIFDSGRDWQQGPGPK